jgi:hypothetical protein
VTWLSISANLPVTYEHPRIEFASPAEMYVVRTRAHASSLSPGSAVAARQDSPIDGMRRVEALYDDRSRTIYLPADWKGSTPSEVSVLVHEMVHHLQNVAGLKYECPQAREKPAYAAQDKWLAQFGRNLLDEFKLDPMTLLLRTKCMH